MTTPAFVRLLLLALFTFAAQVASADEFVLLLERGEGNPRQTSHRERIPEIVHFMLSEDMRDEIQQGDTLKVYFPDNWTATYLISEKRTVDNIAIFHIIETGYPGSFSVAPSEARRAGPPPGCLDPTVSEEKRRRHVLIASGGSNVPGEMDRRSVGILMFRNRCGE